MTLDQVTIIAFMAGGILLSMLCNQLLLKFSESLGIRNTNDVVVRWSNQSKPSLFYIYRVIDISTFFVRGIPVKKKKAKLINYQIRQ